MLGTVVILLFALSQAMGNMNGGAFVDPYDPKRDNFFVSSGSGGSYNDIRSNNNVPVGGPYGNSGSSAMFPPPRPAQMYNPPSAPVMHVPQPASNIYISPPASDIYIPPPAPQIYNPPPAPKIHIPQPAPEMFIPPSAPEWFMPPPAPKRFIHHRVTNMLIPPPAPSRPPPVSNHRIFEIHRTAPRPFNFEDIYIPPTVHKTPPSHSENTPVQTPVTRFSGSRELSSHIFSPKSISHFAASRVYKPRMPVNPPTEPPPFAYALYPVEFPGENTKGFSDGRRTKNKLYN